MTDVVLDAGAVLAYLRSEPGTDIVRGLLFDPDTRCHIHAINLYEVCYVLIRDTSEIEALRAVHDLENGGVIVHEEMDAALWQEAARLKVASPMSPPDSFGIALARRLGCEFVTTDHAELDRADQAGLCAFHFIR